ncbi:MAG: hypothetical protein ALAOOOJD_01958 [bacterium]|nr:hypothetical protein [bacterium]
MQIFKSRPLSVKEIRDMAARDELDLTPEFQRRGVWTDKARSYLIDTIVRGKPIPKIYFRTIENPATNKTVHAVVDGQQRLTSVLSFLHDGFQINKTHNAELGGMRFSELEKSVQKEILYYEFICDFLLDAPDVEIYDIFARMNKYPVKINDQELRNSQFYGEFKSTVYELALEFNTFWQNNRIFTPKQISRMAEAEFVAELLIAISSGIKAKSKPVIDKAFRDWDDSFPHRIVLMKRFRQTMDIVGAILSESSADSSFRRVPLFYTIFCTIYHMQFGLRDIKRKRTNIKQRDIPKICIALEKVDQLFSVPADEVSSLPTRDREFRQATDVHTIHASNRTIRAEYVIDLIRNAIDNR